MSTSEITLSVISFVVVFILTAGGIAYLIKALISNNRKDYIKMLILLGLVVVTKIVEWYFVF